MQEKTLICPTLLGHVKTGLLDLERYPKLNNRVQGKKQPFRWNPAGIHMKDAAKLDSNESDFWARRCAMSKRSWITIPHLHTHRKVLKLLTAIHHCLNSRLKCPHRRKSDSTQISRLKFVGPTETYLDF